MHGGVLRAHLWLDQPPIFLHASLIRLRVARLSFQQGLIVCSQASSLHCQTIDLSLQRGGQLLVLSQAVLRIHAKVFDMSQGSSCCWWVMPSMQACTAKNEAFVCPEVKPKRDFKSRSFCRITMQSLLLGTLCARFSPSGAGDAAAGCAHFLRGQPPSFASWLRALVCRHLWPPCCASRGPPASGAAGGSGMHWLQSRHWLTPKGPPASLVTDHLGARGFGMLIRMLRQCEHGLVATAGYNPCFAVVWCRIIVTAVARLH